MLDGVSRFEDGSYGWAIGGIERSGFKTIAEAGKDYVVQLLDHEPALRPEIHGKTWRAILKILEIQA